MLKIKQILEKASKFEKMAFEEKFPAHTDLLRLASEFATLSENNFIKTATAERFAEIIREYDTAPLVVDDFVAGLKMSAHKGYDNGKGFSQEALVLLLKQADIIEAALETVKPELAAIDEEIYNIPV